VWWLHGLVVDELGIWLSQYADTLQGPDSAVFWWFVWTLDDWHSRWFVVLDEWLTAVWGDEDLPWDEDDLP